MHMIPAEDLTRQYQLIKTEIAAAVDRVLPSGKYTKRKAIFQVL